MGVDCSSLTKKDMGVDCISLNKKDMGVDCISLNKKDMGLDCSSLNKKDMGFNCSSLNKKDMGLHSLVPRPWLLPSPDGLVTQLQKFVLMGGVMSVLIEVSKILQALKAV